MYMFCFIIQVMDKKMILSRKYGVIGNHHLDADQCYYHLVVEHERSRFTKYLLIWMAVKKVI